MFHWWTDEADPSDPDCKFSLWFKSGDFACVSNNPLVCRLVKFFVGLKFIHF